MKFSWGQLDSSFFFFIWTRILRIEDFQFHISSCFFFLDFFFLAQSFQFEDLETVASDPKCPSLNWSSVKNAFHLSNFPILATSDMIWTVFKWKISSIGREISWRETFSSREGKFFQALLSNKKNPKITKKFYSRFQLVLVTWNDWCLSK